MRAQFLLYFGMKAKWLYLLLNMQVSDGMFYRNIIGSWKINVQSFLF